MVASSNAKDRSPQPSQKSQDCESTSRDGSLGAIQFSSSEYGLDSFGTGREDSNKSDTYLTANISGSSISGKIISQLIDETEKNLAYHQKQLAYHAHEEKQLTYRLQELKQLIEGLVDVDHK